MLTGLPPVGELVQITTVDGWSAVGCRTRLSDEQPVTRTLAAMRELSAACQRAAEGYKAAMERFARAGDRSAD